MSSDSTFFTIKEQRRENLAFRDRAEKLETAFHDLVQALQKGTIRFSRDMGMPIPSKPFAFEVVFGMKEWKKIKEITVLHPVRGTLQRLDVAIKGLKLALEIGATPDTCPLCSDQEDETENEKHVPICPWAKVREAYDLASSAVRREANNAQGG